MNYEFKGTPGPWKVATKEDNHTVGLRDGLPYNQIQDAVWGYFNPEQSIGFFAAGIMSNDDARLIAAAPDLLQAAINVVKSCGRDNLMSPACGDLDDLKAAILKALNINT